MSDPRYAWFFEPRPTPAHPPGNDAGQVVANAGDAEAKQSVGDFHTLLDGSELVDLDVNPEGEEHP